MLISANVLATAAPLPTEHFTIWNLKSGFIRILWGVEMSFDEFWGSIFVKCLVGRVREAAAEVSETILYGVKKNLGGIHTKFQCLDLRCKIKCKFCFYSVGRMSGKSLIALFCLKFFQVPALSPFCKSTLPFKIRVIFPPFLWEIRRSHASSRLVVKDSKNNLGLLFFKKSGQSYE